MARLPFGTAFGIAWLLSHSYWHSPANSTAALAVPERRWDSVSAHGREPGKFLWVLASASRTEPLRNKHAAGMRGTSTLGPGWFFRNRAQHRTRKATPEHVPGSVTRNHGHGCPPSSVWSRKAATELPGANHVWRSGCNRGSCIVFFFLISNHRAPS